MVVFSWLVVGVLHAEPKWVGVAQTSTTLPALLFVLFGGAVADRVDPRRMLIGMHALAAVPVLLLAAAVATGTLTLFLLCCYGVAIGTISAFSMPARDTLLSRVAGADLMRAITSVTAAQFGAQSAGNLLAGSSRWWGTLPILVAQALLLLAGAAAYRRVPPPEGRAPAPAHSTLRGIAHSLGSVAREPRLHLPLSLVTAVSLFFIGSYTVAVPLLVRDIYRGDEADIAGVFMLFPLGTIAGSLWLRGRGIRNKGRAALIALTLSCMLVATMASGLPLRAVMAATFCWGLCGSVFINATRTLYQTAAPIQQRAGVLSVYQLGFLGGVPLGALAAGFVASVVGVQSMLLLAAGGMLLFVGSVWLGTGMARME
jgi:predicted MFS family arabinose efflux permease